MTSHRLDDRASGVLVHLTCLPGPHGNGDLGDPARGFVDFLARAGQRWWQMLPVGPPGYGESPYSAQSAFAGNPLLVSLEDLAQEGLLDESSLRAPGLAPDRFDAAPAERHRMSRLASAFRVWRGRAEEPAYARFCRRNARWLGDFALFRALKRARRGVQWTLWERALARRKAQALSATRRELADEIAFERFVQYKFDAQWTRLKAYAHERGVGLIGDVPLVVAHDSADVWQHRELFRLDSSGEVTSVAGVPPDYFSSSGQRWGNPIYRWDRMKRQGYRWWTERIRLMLRRFDAVRLDHFIGFHRYWQIPRARADAVVGRWMRGPGADLFSALTRALGPLPLIAEDLGVVTPEVFALRDRFAFPGTKILQFAFGADPFAFTFLPHNYPRAAVVYTGTHDNDTTVGWFHDPGGGSSTRSPRETQAERDAALAYLGSRGDEIHWDLIRAALASVANLAIVPVQDLLGLGSEARMNRPGTQTGNWAWRVPEGALDRGIEDRLARLTQSYGRRAKDD